MIADFVKRLLASPVGQPHKTMKSFKCILLLTTLVGGIAVVGCKEKGPMEQAGENIDKAAKQTEEAAKDAVEKAKDAPAK
jgi:hypothetical protein